MQLVVGGAYSGKRKLVRHQNHPVIWHSAYKEALLTEWRFHINSSSFLVLEGWEKWIKDELSIYSSLDEVKAYFFAKIDEICEAEKIYDTPVIFIMLEMGRGIVPLNEEERNMRDVAGWILQYAATKADSVQYCWHGLVTKIK